MRNRRLTAERDEALAEATRLAGLIEVAMVMLAGLHVWCEHESEQRTGCIDALAGASGVPVSDMVSQMLREHELAFIAASVDEGGTP